MAKSKISLPPDPKRIKKHLDDVRKKEALLKKYKEYLIKTGRIDANNRSVYPRQKGTEDKKQINPEDLIVTFGMYAKKKVSELPDNYLEWSIKNYKPGEWLNIFKGEFERRKNK